MPSYRVDELPVLSTAGDIMLNVMNENGALIPLIYLRRNVNVKVFGFIGVLMSDHYYIAHT